MAKLFASSALLLLLLLHSASACCNGMVMNQLGLNLLEEAEGFSATPYKDVAGNPTICYGHLIKPTDNFRPPLSRSQCQAILQQDVASAQSCVQRSVRVDINSNQFSALVDFVFNLGCGSLESSTLLRLLNSGDKASVPAQLMRWVYSGGKVYAGLQRRRKNEGNLWNTPVGAVYAPAPQPRTTSQATTATQGTTPAPLFTSSFAPVSTTGGGFLLAEQQEQTGHSSAMSSSETTLIAVGVVAGVLCVAVGVALRLRSRREADAPLLTTL